MKNKKRNESLRLKFDTLSINLIYANAFIEAKKGTSLLKFLFSVIRLGPWNKFFMLLNSLNDNEVTKIKILSSAHL
jgi:hypothetical protein